MRDLVFEVRLREDTRLPINVVSSEARMRLLELLDQHLDIRNITYKGEWGEDPTSRMGRSTS